MPTDTLFVTTGMLRNEYQSYPRETRARAVTPADRGPLIVNSIIAHQAETGASDR